MIHLLSFFLLHILFFSLRYSLSIFFFFFFNDTATTEIYTLSLHDALPIYWQSPNCDLPSLPADSSQQQACVTAVRSEEHTSELQSRENLVCRLLLEKKKKKEKIKHAPIAAKP